MYTSGNFQRLVLILMRISYLTRYIVLRLNLETTKAKLNALTRPQRVLPKLTKFYIANVQAEVEQKNEMYALWLDCHAHRRCPILVTGNSCTDISNQ